MMHFRPTPKAAWLTAALCATLAGTASAGALRVEVAGAAGHQPAAGEFVFAIRNTGSERLEQIRILADRRHALGCSAQTTQGRGFVDHGVLAAGDSVECRGRSLAPGKRTAASIAVRARTPGGKAAVQVAHLAMAPTAALDQGVPVVLGGSTLNDANGDGILDAGETIDYHYTVLNAGTLGLSGLALADLGGAVACPQTSLAPGAWMACISQHAITAAEAADGFVVNEATLTGSDANGEPVEAGDMVLRMNLDGTADVRAFKSPLLADDADGSGYASVGDLIGYTFVVKNGGVQALSAVNLVEPDPTRLDGPITCAANTLGGQPFAGLGSGTLGSYDSVLCHADYTIKAADAAAGEADNLADVSGQPTFGGPVTGAAASAVVVPLPASIEVAKALVGESGSKPGIAEPGETLTYGIRLDNAGSIDAHNVGVTDVLDAYLVFVSASHGGTHGGGIVNWTNLTVPAGGHLDLTVVATVVDPLPAGVTSVANLAAETGTVPPDCTVMPLPANCVVTPTEGQVAIAKALVGENGSKPGIAEPGEELTYAITLVNGGGSAVTGFGVTDPLDPNVSFVSADNGGMLSGHSVVWSGLTIPASGSLTLTVVVQVNTPVPEGATQVVNVATETGTPPVDCSIMPLPDACSVVPLEPEPRLQVTKSVDTPSAQPGENVTFTITVANVGVVDALNVTIDDPIPLGYSQFVWTCSGSGGASCPNAAGSGGLAELVPVFPVGGMLTYIVVATLDANANGSLPNTVWVEPSSLTVCMPGATPAPCEATAIVTTGRTIELYPVPVDNRLALSLLALGLAFLGWRRGMGARR